METAEYEKAFSRAIDGACRAFGRPLSFAAVEEAASRLLCFSRVQQRLSLAKLHPSNAILILRCIVRQGYGFRRTEPGRYHEAVRAAVHLAARLPARGQHQRVIEDLRAEGWAHLGNARRIQDDLPAADVAFTKAEWHLHRGTGDLQLQAEVNRLKAPLRKDQGRAEDARRLLEEAIATYDALQEPELGARARLGLGIVYLRLGEVGSAARLCRAAGEVFDPVEHQRFMLDALHNLALCAAEAGSLERALDLLTLLVPLYAASGDTVLQVRVGWVAGRILAHKQDWEGAARAFELVRRELSQRGLFFDAALAGLELALAYLHVGRVAEVKGLALEMVPVFEAQQIPREASAALLLFVEAARREALTVEDVAQLVADLKGRLAPPGRRGSQGRFMA